MCVLQHSSSPHCNPTPAPFPGPHPQKAEFAFKHFEADPNMSFALLEEDPVTKRPVSGCSGYTDAMLRCAALASHAAAGHLALTLPLFLPAAPPPRRCAA